MLSLMLGTMKRFLRRLHKIKYFWLPIVFQQKVSNMTVCFNLCLTRLSGIAFFENHRLRQPDSLTAWLMYHVISSGILLMEKKAMIEDSLVFNICFVFVWANFFLVFCGFSQLYVIEFKSQLLSKIWISRQPNSENKINDSSMIL